MKLIIIVFNFLLFNFVLLIFFYLIFLDKIDFLLFKFRSLILFYLIFLFFSWMRNNLSSSKIVVIKKALT